MCNATTLRRIIAIHKNKATLKHLKTKKEGQLEVKDMNDSEEEKDNERDDVPLKRKRQGEDKASRLKRTKSSKV